MSGSYTLYGRPGAGSVAPQILLEELGLPYDVVWVEDSPAYRRLNPTGKIPALTLLDGTTIFESAAICLHLTGAHSQVGLAPPSGTPAHARYLQWTVFLSANLYDALLRYFYAARFSADGEAAVAGVQKQALADCERHIALIEDALSPYLLGDKPGAADFYLFMLAGWYPPDPAPLYAKFPKLGALVRMIEARPAVARVMQAQE